MCLALACPSAGSACMHEVVYSKDDAVAEVARAERLLAAGDAYHAYRTARRARRRLERALREEGREASTRAVVERATQVTTVAVVRLDGFAPVSARTSRTHVLRGRQERSLEHAIGVLRARFEARPSDLRAEAQLAEALARVPAHRAEARAILERLAERDLMPDAHGYAALLRVTTPGSPVWETALGRCQTMAASNASQICPASSTPSS